MLAPDAGGRPAPGAGLPDAEMAVIPVPLALLTGVGSMRLTVPPDLRGADARRATLLMLRVGVGAATVPCTRETPDLSYLTDAGC